MVQRRRPFAAHLLAVFVAVHLAIFIALGIVGLGAIARLGACLRACLRLGFGALGIAGIAAAHASHTITAAASGINCAAGEAGGDQYQGKNFRGISCVCS